MGRNRSNIVNRMIRSVIAGFIVGFLVILLREFLLNNGYNNIWALIDAVFFQDITKTDSFNGLGIFYIISELFLRGLQLAIIPLILSSLSLAICNLSNPQKLGRIASRTLYIYVCFYIVAAFLSGTAAYFIKTMGWFNVNLPSSVVGESATANGYNPLTTITSAIPSNLFASFSSNEQVLSVVFVAIILGFCMNKLGEKTKNIKNLIVELNEIVQYFLNVLINKFGAIAIFCMITRALAVYGIEYIKPTFIWMLSTIVIGLVLLVTIYPIGICLMTGLNPIIFLKKSMKIAIFAAATNSSAATLPINMQTCKKELGCSEEISSFVLPTGMTINMNGTTVMHMIAITFIATAAGINIQPSTLVIAAFLSICTAMGTPAIPVAGTTMIYVVMSGIGLNSELCMIGYSLVLAMNYLPGMAVITLNVIGDAATNVIVSHKEGELDKNIYSNENNLVTERKTIE